MTTIVDNFNRADSATTPNPASDGGSWTVDGGAFGITSNALYLASTSPAGTLRGGTRLCRRDTSQVAADVTVDSIRPSTSGESDIFVSFNPANGNAYVLQFDSSATFFYISKLTGPNTYVQHGPFSVTAWTAGSTTLRFTHDGAGVLTAYQGGVQVGTWTDTSSPYTGAGYTWAGLAELTVSTGKFDNFTAAASTPPVAVRRRPIVASQIAMRAAAVR